jgi:hypothetical protein
MRQAYDFEEFEAYRQLGYLMGNTYISQEMLEASVIPKKEEAPDCIADSRDSLR